MKKYTIELTEAQVIWLENLLDKGLDGYFGRDVRARKHCDNIQRKVEDLLIEPK